MKQPTPPGADRNVVDASVVLEKLLDALIPGFQAEFDPDEAALAGAFIEDALSEQEAIDSDIDLIAALITVNPLVAANDEVGRS